MISREHVLFNDSLVGELTKEIEEGCYWSRLPILADALEDAGCTDDRIPLLRIWDIKIEGKIPSERVTSVLILLSEVHEIYKSELLNRKLREGDYTTISVIGG